jgi:hypothetical protein
VRLNVLVPERNELLHAQRALEGKQQECSDPDIGQPGWLEQLQHSVEVIPCQADDGFMDALLPDRLQQARYLGAAYECDRVGRVVKSAERGKEAVARRQRPRRGGCPRTEQRRRASWHVKQRNDEAALRSERTASASRGARIQMRARERGGRRSRRPYLIGSL